MQRVHHEISPIFNKESEILILGSFPSVKSREGAFFYHHPQNRFWKVLSAVLECRLPLTIEEKKEMLLAHHIAIWDVIQSCTITGSSDSSIRDVVPNDLNQVLKEASIRTIYTNGAASYKLYEKYCRETTGVQAVKLPSSSPANAIYTIERLVQEWNAILL